MAQVDPQDRWAEASALSGLNEEPPDPRKLSMNLVKMRMVGRQETEGAPVTLITRPIQGADPM